jgi:hypothetical protein
VNKKTATIILNRNLPDVTDNLVNHIRKFDGELTDIFVIEAGSDKINLSKNMTWYINDAFTKKYGLRYPRGLNLSIKKLHEESKLNDYDSIFFITNDTILENKKTIEPLRSILIKHDKVGVLSPCSKNWGEKLILKDEKVKYFWFIHSHAYFLRKDFIDDLCNFEEDYITLLFDGNNFRGWGLETELIAKGYANNWASAITSEVIIEENNSLLFEKSDLIKTEHFDKNLELYIQEGKQWMKKKYGFTSKWDLIFYAKSFYNDFFKKNQNLLKYKI